MSLPNNGFKLLNLGAISSAIAASICCFGPLLLALSGLGGGALLLRLTPYRPYFLVGTAGLLAASFYQTYRRPTSDGCGPEAVCARSSNRTVQKIVLWIVTVLVLLVAAFPYYSEQIF